MGLLVIIRHDHSLLYLNDLLECELRLNLRVLGFNTCFDLCFGLLDCGASVLSQIPDLHRPSSKAAVIRIIRSCSGKDIM